MSKKNMPEQPKEDLGALNTPEPEQPKDMGKLSDAITEKVDMGALPPLPKFYKYKRGK